MERDVLTESDVHHIVLEFLKSYDLVRNTSMLCGGLGIYGADLVEINVAGGKPTYDSLKLVLEKWILMRGDDATIDTLVLILDHLGFKNTADAIRQYPHFVSTDSYIWHEVPNSVPNFVGRNVELRQIQDFFESRTIEKSRKVMVISGLGGLGKSELAKMVAKKFEGPHKNVAWILAESHQMLSEGFKTLASKRLNIRTEHLDGTEIDVRIVVESVYKSLAQKSSLVIFDNAESYRENKEDDLYNFLPESFNFSPSFNFPNVLITTRLADFIPFSGRAELDCFTPTESRLFLMTYLSCPTNESDIEKLSEVLEDFPLALQQAVAYINQSSIVKNNYAIQDYLMEFQIRAEYLLNFEFCSGSRIPYAKTTLITWTITLEKIRKIRDYGKIAVEVLEIIAYLAADNIQLPLLQQILVPDENYRPCRIEEGFLILRKYTMIKFQNGVANVHRLVQQVTRLQSSKNKTSSETVTNIIETFTKQFNLSSFQLTNISRLISPWRHCTECAKWTDKFKNVPTKIVQFLGEKIKWKESVTFGNEALSTLLSHLPDDETNVLNLKYELGELLFSTGNYDQALHYFVEVSALRAVTLSSQHADTLRAKHNVARSQRSKENYEKTLKLYGEVLRRREDMVGIDHRDTLDTRHAIAVTYNSLGNYDRALKVYEALLGKRVATLDFDHSDTLETKNETAVTYDNQRNYDQAMRIYHDVLETRQDTLRADHPDTIMTIHQMAETYYNQGSYDRALEIVKDVLKRGEVIWGIDHPDTLTTKQNIAITYSRQGNYGRAFIMYEEVLQKTEETLGFDHPDTLTTGHEIAVTYHNQGNYDRALEMYQDVLMKREETLGIGHPDTLKTKQEIGVTYYNQQNYDKALEMYEDVLKKREETLGIDHPDTLKTKREIGVTYHDQQNYDRALEMYEDVLRKREETLGIDHPDTLKTKREIVVTYHDQRNYDRALEIYIYVLKRREETFGPHSPQDMKLL